MHLERFSEGDVYAGEYRSEDPPILRQARDPFLKVTDGRVIYKGGCGPPHPVGDPLRSARYLRAFFPIRGRCQPLLEGGF